MKKVLACLFVILMSVCMLSVFLPVNVSAADDGDCTSLLNGNKWCNGDENTIIELLKTIIQILTAGVVVLGTIGMIWCGFLILSARDNESQVAAAKKRLIDIVIGIVIFVLFDLAVNLLLPGKTGAGLLGP